MRRIVYLLTIAGVSGLVIFHADDVARVASSASSTFRKAVNLA